MIYFTKKNVVIKELQWRQNFKAVKESYLHLTTEE